MCVTLRTAALTLFAVGAFTPSADAQPLRLLRASQQSATAAARTAPTWNYQNVRSLYGPGPYGRDTPAATPNNGYRPPLPYGYAYPYVNGGYPNVGPHYLGW